MNIARIRYRSQSWFEYAARRRRRGSLTLICEGTGNTKAPDGAPSSAKTANGRGNKKVRYDQKHAWGVGYTYEVDNLYIGNLKRP